MLTVPHHPEGPVVESTHRATTWALEQLQHWLADARFSGTRLAVVTRAAVSTGEGDPVTDLPAAAVWGWSAPRSRRIRTGSPWSTWSSPRTTPVSVSAPTSTSISRCPRAP
ncbi:hypothetical protein NKH77_45740 [Streptomyces sp. M19]